MGDFRPPDSLGPLLSHILNTPLSENVVKGRVAQKNECGYVTFISQEVADNTNYTKIILRLIFTPNISMSHTLYDTESLT